MHFARFSLQTRPYLEPEVLICLALCVLSPNKLKVVPIAKCKNQSQRPRLISGDLPIDCKKAINHQMCIFTVVQCGGGISDCRQLGTRQFGTRTIGQQELKADNSAKTWQNGQFGIKQLIWLDWTTYNSYQHLEQRLSFRLSVCQIHIEEIMLSNYYFDVVLLGAKFFVSLCLYKIVCCQIVYFLILVPICLFVSYLIFVIFLHGQNFWRIKFTPKKRVNYYKIHRKLPFFALLRQNTQ